MEREKSTISTIKLVEAVCCIDKIHRFLKNVVLHGENILDKNNKRGNFYG